MDRLREVQEDGSDRSDVLRRREDRVLTSVGLEMQVAESEEELLLYEYAFDRAEEVDGELVLKDDGESGGESGVESE